METNTQRRAQNISVNIDGIVLPLTVFSPEEEQLFRNAAAAARTRISSLRQRYPEQADSTYWAMALLNTMVESMRHKQNNNTQPFVDLLTQLGNEIDNATSANRTANK